MHLESTALTAFSTALESVCYKPFAMVSLYRACSGDALNVGVFLTSQQFIVRLHSRVLTTNLSNPSVKNKTFQSLVNHRHRVCISSDVVSVEKQRIPNFDRSK